MPLIFLFKHFSFPKKTPHIHQSFKDSKNIFQIVCIHMSLVIGTVHMFEQMPDINKGTEINKGTKPRDNFGLPISFEVFRNLKLGTKESLPSTLVS